MKCAQCGPLGCGWDVCRLSGESTEEYRQSIRDANSCAEFECPGWWGCKERGCYSQAKRNYANGVDHRAPLPGNPEYLTTNDRTEMVGSYNVVAANYGAYKRKGQ